MPKTKLSQRNTPPVDYVKACMLERKLALKLNYDEIAKGANITPDYLRKLMTTKHTDDWSPDIRKAVCKELGINIQTTISMVTEDKTGIRLNQGVR